jgi:hypothetical protein
VLAGEQPAKPGRHADRRPGSDHGSQKGQPFADLSRFIVDDVVRWRRACRARRRPR